MKQSKFHRLTTSGHDGENAIYVILGKKGSGKSTLAHEMVEEFDRVLIMDSSGEYEEVSNAVIFEDAKLAANYLVEHKDDKRFVIDAMILDRQEALDLMAVAFEIPNILVVIEEASLYTSPYELPDEIGQIIRYGRKRGISLIAIARRPSEISRELTAQADVLITFQQDEPRDLQYLYARMGKDAEMVPNLKRYHVAISGDRSKLTMGVIRREQKNSLDNTSEIE